MTIEQCYQMIGGSYEETLGRIPGRETLCKFLGAFLQDPSFSQLCAAVDSGDPEAAFLAAHTLKGVCGNLGLGGLQRSAGELTEVLRRRARPIPAEARPLLEAVERDYERTAAAIGTFLEER